MTTREERLYIRHLCYLGNALKRFAKLHPKEYAEYRERARQWKAAHTKKETTNGHERMD